MPGDHIHILEKDPVPGGACDGLDIPGLGYVMRGGLYDPHEVLEAQLVPRSTDIPFGEMA